MWVVQTKRGPFKTKQEACEHASHLMHYIPEIYEVGIIELPLRSADDLAADGLVDVAAGHGVMNVGDVIPTDVAADGAG